MDGHREPLPSRVEGLPDLPADALAALDDGLRSLALDPPPGPAVRAALEGHLRLLQAWNASVNLTAVRDPVEAVRRHTIDSLTAAPILAANGVHAFVDLGSGGGFPGLPLALVLPLRRALLVDSIGKKARFLETCVRALGCEDRVEAFAGRAEALAADARHRGRWPAVLVRAVAGLPELAELALPLLAPGGLLVAWKQVPIADELGAARAAIDELGGGRPEVVPVDGERLGLPGHLLVVVRKERPTPPGYPRDPADRKRRPWA